MKKFLAAVMMLISLSGVGCAGAEPQNLSGSVNQFCWKYFALRKDEFGTFFSPYGIHCALSILANGANDDARKEILNALEVDSLDELNAAHKKFSEFAAKNYDDFAAANLLLVDKKIVGRGFNENFKRIVSDNYKSEIRTADFSGDEKIEREKVRLWAAGKTKNFIDECNSFSNFGTPLSLVNVVCFSGRLELPFTSGHFRKEFTNRDGSEGTAVMISNVFTNEIKYRADEKFKGIELPYKSNAALYLILPTDDGALNVADAWNAETFEYRENFLDYLSDCSAFSGEVVVRIPRMEFEYDNLSYQDFQSLGLQRLFFKDDATLSNIVAGKALNLGSVVQNCKGTAIEPRTEAATIKATDAPKPQPPQKVYFIANRPFVFVIRDVESGVILFAGAVNQL